MILFEIAWIAFLLWILYGTSAVYEYIRLVPFVDRWTRITSYEQFKKNDPELRYSDFMLSMRPTFLVRLFSCPFCFGFWLTAGTCLFFGNPVGIPVVYGGGVLGYCLFKKLMGWING